MLDPLTRRRASAEPPKLRWWPAIVILASATAAVVWVQAQSDWPFQKRNLTSLPIVAVASALLLGWWAFFSRAPRAWRFGITLGLVLCLAAGAALFRIRGVSGDLVPILEYRWAQPASAPDPAPPATGALASTAEPFRTGTNDFPQFYGPNRDGVLPGPNLETNWTAHPPVEMWRRKVGAAWSGFVIVGDLCLTQEQRGDTESVVAYDLATGRERWNHHDPARYHTTIAGEGPRATPAVSFQPRVRSRFDGYSERSRARFRPIDLVAQCRGRVRRQSARMGFYQFAPGRGRPGDRSWWRRRRQVAVRI